LTKQATRNKESKNNQQKRPKLNQKNNPKNRKKYYTLLQAKQKN
jgi:hypothetical protein